MQLGDLPTIHDVMFTLGIAILITKGHMYVLFFGEQLCFAF